MTDGAFLVRDRRDGGIYCVFASFDSAADWILDHYHVGEYYIDGWELKP